MRVVSLLPSATDIVVALGAKGDLIGVSHSCSGDWQELAKLTSTWLDLSVTSGEIDAQVRKAARPLYELDIERLRELAPDVVISQSLCDVCAVPAGDVVQAVQALPGNPTLIDLAPRRLADLPGCFTAVGAAIGRENEAAALIEHWDAGLSEYRGVLADSGLRVGFLDWVDPPFAAGHWIPEMLEWLGVQSVLGRAGEPSFSLDWGDVAARRPDVLVIACCGFSEQRSREELTKLPCPAIYLDGHELFSRPSPALLESMAELAGALQRYLRS